MKKLNNELDSKYAEPLDELTLEFERIVMKSDGSSFPDKCRNFLKPLASGKDQEFYSKIVKREELVNAVAGLDTMIFKYEFHTTDSLSTRKHISNKWNSNFIKALSTLKECDELISGYVETIVETGGLGPVLVANGAIMNYSDEDFNNPIVKRILAVEVLLPYLTYSPE
ncbi:hypothetical protein [Marivirga tractuosa]|uniref:hypothetical protein n=1 Tax=Marivirga tractuosa TaxID=1006 RepID=UPI0011D22C7D|nr:hypothetical protein [Marivirga tractuosa]